MKLKMKYLTLIIINIAFLFSGFICAKSTDKSDNSPLPDTRPADISFRYHVNGGMMYYFENLYISADSCYYEVNDGGSVSKSYFKMNSDQLDRLYKTFKENDFDKIKTYEEKVYDRGGENISLSWGKKYSCSISNSGMSFIKDSWHKEWNNCESAMTGIIAEEIPKLKKNYEIKFDGSLFNKEIYMQINRDVVIPKSMLMAEHEYDKEIIRTVKLSPGKHNASVMIGKTYSTIKINADSTKGLLLKWQNDSLKYEFIK